MKIKLDDAMLMTKRGIEGLRPDLSNQDSARYLAINGKKAKGVYFAVKVGTNTIQIQLSGSAKMLLGFTLDADKAGFGTTYFTLKVNNEIILDEVAARDYLNSRLSGRDFFEYIRQLTGSDNIKIEYTTGEADDIRFTFYYI